MLIPINAARARLTTLALGAVVSLPALAVHWAPAQAIFDTVDFSLRDWLWSAAIASSTLWLEEARKLLLVLWRRACRRIPTGEMQGARIR